MLKCLLINIQLEIGCAFAFTRRRRAGAMEVGKQASVAENVVSVD